VSEALKNLLNEFEDQIRTKCGAKEFNLTTDVVDGVEEKIKNEIVKIKINNIS